MPPPIPMQPATEEDWWEKQRREQGVTGPVRKLRGADYDVFKAPAGAELANPNDLAIAKQSWAESQRGVQRQPMRAIMNGQEYEMAPRMASPKSDIALKMIENARAERLAAEARDRQVADEQKAAAAKAYERTMARQDAADEDRRKLAFRREEMQLQNEMDPASDVKRQQALMAIDEMKRRQADAAEPAPEQRAAALSTLPEPLQRRYGPMVSMAGSVAELRQIVAKAAEEAGSMTPGKLLGDTISTAGDVASSYAASLQAAIDKNDTAGFQQIISAMEEEAADELTAAGQNPDPAKVKAILQRKLLQLGIRPPAPVMSPEQRRARGI